MVWDFPHYHGSGWTPGRAMRTGPWKLVYFFEDNRYELYHILKDPGEQTNLAIQEEAKLNEMKKLLNQWAIEMGAKSPTKNQI